MQPKRQKYTEYISKGLIKFAPDEESFNNFCSQLKVFIEKVNSSIQANQTEENLKSHLEHFLKDAFYTNKAIETKSYKGQIQADLVIYQENKNDSPVEVLIEAKKPDNKTEMVFL
ncbi:MAG: hypothetical protein QNJ31_01040 [Candidatus Caenarcaniphilales bacterium]|nr:hypothetical protein [Candidatus Caenarcaniphilales bacterium]